MKTTRSACYTVVDLQNKKDSLKRKHSLASTSKEDNFACLDFFTDGELDGSTDDSE